MMRIMQSLFDFPEFFLPLMTPNGRRSLQTHRDPKFLSQNSGFWCLSDNWSSLLLERVDGVSGTVVQKGVVRLPEICRTFLAASFRDHTLDQLCYQAQRTFGGILFTSRG
jgi:hypothetical protein